MTIRSKLIIIAILPLMLAFVTGLLQYRATQELNCLEQRALIADDIHKKLSELAMRTFDHHLSAEQQSRWLQSYRQAEVLFQKTETLFPDLQDQHVLRRARTRLQGIGALYGRYGDPDSYRYGKLASSDHSHHGIRSVFRELQIIMDDMDRLHGVNQEKALTHAHRQKQVILVVIAALALTVPSTALLIMRAFSAPLARLREGIRRISSGDLDYRIDSDRSGELGELAAAIDEMAEHRQRADEELVRLNEQLEYRVMERTTALTMLNSELYREIEERRRVEQLTRDALEFNQKIVDNAPVGIALYDASGQCLRANDALAEIIGLRTDALVRQNFRELPSWQDSGLLALANDVLHRGITEGTELHLVSSAGREIRTRVVMTSLLARNEQHLLAIFQDLTDRERAEEDLKRYAGALEQSNRELEHFAYVASHDLQEPLRKIASFSELLQRRYQGQLDESADRYLAFIIDGALRMRTLINDLLAISRVTTRGGAFALTDCTELLTQVLEDLEIAIRESKATITSDPLPTVSGDRTQLGQVLQNLIGNAIKYRSDSPPRIHVSARRKRSEWVISVRDNGIGIEPQYFERIFVIFQRLHTRTEYSGTGIGLALCRKIVERHGGRIWVESTPGQGSTFLFTLPHNRKERTDGTEHER